MERQVKWIWTSFLNILRLPAKIRSISLQNLCRTVILLKYRVICWTSLTLIVVSLARPESRMILLMVWTITFQGYFYARSKVGVACVSGVSAVTRARVKHGLDQSTLTTGRGAVLTCSGSLGPSNFIECDWYLVKSVNNMRERERVLH